MRIWILGLKRPLKVGLMAAVVVAVVSIFLPNYYRSDARILPVETKSGLGSLGGLATAAAALGFSLPGSDGSDNNAVDILQSRWLRERLLTADFGFRQRSWRFGGETGRQQTLYAYLKAKNLDDGLKRLAPMISISRDTKSKIITLSVESRSATLSRAMAQKSLALLEVFLREKGRTRGGAKAAFAEARLREARSDMDKVEDSFRHFLEGNRNYQTSADPTIRLTGARMEAELKLRQQLLMTLAVNREQALMEEKNDMPILNVMDEANLPYEKSKPIRSVWVLATFIIAGVGTWIYYNREWVRERLLAPDAPTGTKTKE